MPPHCDTLDGPVVSAAKKALESGNVKLILPWAPKESEQEIRKAFERTLAARKAGGAAKEVADLWFYETVVRLHRAGEGAPYTGLKPAGLDEGPVVPKAEKAVEEGDAKELVGFLQAAVKEEVEKKFRHALHTRDYDPDDVEAARKHVKASLGLTLYSHHLYEYLRKAEEH